MSFLKQFGQPYFQTTKNCHLKTNKAESEGMATNVG
jgi:hypothetical protein